MNILIINGSPKGPASITLQTLLWLEKLHPEHDFHILHAGQRIKGLERNFAEAEKLIADADLLIFSYPVYTFIAPCQLHRFIELMKEHCDLTGKYAAQLTTSKHFYDTTAHRYIRDNCEEMGMRYLHGLSADMEDLLTEKGRREADSFFDHLCWQIERGFSEPKLPVMPAVPLKAVSPAENVPKKDGDVVIVADLANDPALAAMIDRFRAVLPRKSRVVNIREVEIRGGCLGCFRCTSDGKCVYTDGFDEFLRTRIQSAEAVVCAFTVRDHSMGSRFKMYDDRQFCNGHRTVTMGSPVGYLVNGQLSAEENLRTIMEARAQVGSNFLAGIACNEEDPDGQIDRLAAELDYALIHKHRQPQNFYGVGGMKIFRDLIWQMQGMMRADHKFFRSHGQYDFPQKKRGKMMAMYLVGLLNSPKIRDKVGSRMTEGMLAPYRKVVDSVNDKE